MPKRKERQTEHALYVSADTLAGMLDVGRAKAVAVGIAAGARIQIGSAVRFSVARVEQYLNAQMESAPDRDERITA